MTTAPSQGEPARKAIAAGSALLLIVSVAVNFVMLTNGASDGPRSLPLTRIPAHTAASRAGRIDPEMWQELIASRSPPDFVRDLRTLGYPPSVIRAIVRARVMEKYADRIKAIAEATAAQPYWLYGPFSSDPKISVLQRALNRDVARELREYMGSDFANATDAERDIARRRYGDLPPEKYDAIQQIQSDYSDLMAEVRMGARSSNGAPLLLAEDREKLAFLEKEMRADLTKTLTPEELEGFDLRNSRTGSLRQTLSAFAPTEQEFLAIYRLQKPIDDRYPTDLPTPEQRRERTEALKALAPQIEAALGPERYAEYVKKTDSRWSSNNRFASDHDLPPATVERLYTLQKDATERAKTLRDSGGSTAEINAQLTALHVETTTQLNAVLGEKLAPAYRAFFGGFWLQGLQPTPARPPTP